MIILCIFCVGVRLGLSPLGNNVTLRKIFGPRRKEVTGDWRKLHSEELQDFCSSSYIITINSRRKRWAGNVARLKRR
jgi:hypothetical protein